MTTRSSVQIMQQVVAAFMQWHHFDPSCWLDKACIDQENIADGLRILPVSVMACKHCLGNLWQHLCQPPLVHLGVCLSSQYSSLLVKCLVWISTPSQYFDLLLNSFFSGVAPLAGYALACRLNVSLEGRLRQGSSEAPRGVGRVFPQLAREWLMRGPFWRPSLFIFESFDFQS